MEIGAQKRQKRHIATMFCLHSIIQIVRIIMDAQKVYLAVQTRILPKAFEILYPEIAVEEYENILNETIRIIEETTAFQKQRYGI